VRIVPHADLPEQQVLEDVLQLCTYASSLLHPMCVVLPHVLVLVLQALQLRLQYFERSDDTPAAGEGDIQGNREETVAQRRDPCSVEELIKCASVKLNV
jgi:hypothetical protein